MEPPMRLTEIVHHELERHLNPGDCVIDATAGNGHDSAKLATCVGASGHLLAIDLQPAAIAATTERLESLGLTDRCTFLCEDHAAALHTLRTAYAGRISAIVFNLGYLPGSDHRIQTEPSTTVAALEACPVLLRPGGLLLVTAYRGHPGGAGEAAQVATWMQQRHNWEVRTQEPTAHGTRMPPILWQARVPGP
jgi:predicted methyltransferase